MLEIVRFKKTILGLILWFTFGLGFGVEPTVPSYSSLKIKSFREIRDLTRETGEEGIVLLEKINRRDRNHMKPGTVLQIPDFRLGEFAHSPFPKELDLIQFLDKVLIVSLRIQAYGAYEAGELVHWGPVCTGSLKQETPANLYYTNWRSRRKRSTINRNWIMNWYFNIHTSMGLAFHQYAMPGQPVSYGCIRLLANDARWIYQWAETWVPSSNRTIPKVWGTPIIAFGRYDYDSPPPWNRLSQDPTAASVTLEEINRAVGKYLWIIEKRHQERINYQSD